MGDARNAGTVGEGATEGEGPEAMQVAADPTVVIPAAEGVTTPIIGEGEGMDTETDSSGGSRRKFVIAGIAGLALAAALGYAAFAGNKAPDPTPTDTPVATKPATTSAARQKRPSKDAEDIADMISRLRFGDDSQDVSVAADKVRVEVSGGRVQVIQVSTDDAATMVDMTARRSAALASALKDVDVRDTTSNDDSKDTTNTTTTDGATSTVDVTWLATNEDGTVQVAVTNDPDSAPTKGDTAELVNDSAGHLMTDEAAAAVKDKGVTQTGGTAPTLLDGTEIVPGETNVPTPAEQPTAKSQDAAASDAKQDNAATDSNAGNGQSANTDSGSSNTNAPANNNASNNSGSGNSQPSQPAQESKPKSGHYEPVYETQPVYETRPVYGEEPVYETRVYYCASDGYMSEDFDTITVYCLDRDLSYGTVSQQVQTGTRTVQVGTEQVQVGTQQVQVGQRWVED